MKSYLLIALAALALVATAAPQRKTPQRPQRVSYAQLAPIFRKSCVGCHHGAKAAHGLDLSSYAALVKGDKEGKVIVGRNPAASRLSKAIHRHGAAPMPPAQPLPPREIALIDGWIHSGSNPK